MPDNADDAWLGWLIANPHDWTEKDLSATRSMIEDQKRALEELHPKDAKGRRSAQGLLDQLEAAVRARLARTA